jgi:multiple sugar transport system substrate-binding protein
MMSASRQFTRRSLLRYGMGATVLGAVGANTACAPIQPDASNGGGANTFTIYWNAGHAYDGYAAVIDEFGKEHDLQINWQKFQWPDLTTKLVADFRSGNVPDLVEEVSAGTGTQYGVPGDVLALDELAASTPDMKFPEDFIAAAVTSRQYQGTTYSVPLHLNANGLLFYNKQLLSAAGFPAPPTTWDEFLEVTKATTTGDVSGTALNSDFTYSKPFLFQQQVAYTDVANRQFLVPSEQADLALQYMQDLIYTHRVSPAPVASTDYSGPQKLFSAKRAATFLSGPWDLEPVRKGSPDIDLGVAPPLTGSVQAASQAGSGLMIPTKAKNPELSWELVTRLTALETELAVTKEVGTAMPRKSWAQDPVVADDPTMNVIAKALAVVAETDPELPASGRAAQINELYEKAYQQIAIQQRPVGEALAEFRAAAKGTFG